MSDYMTTTQYGERRLDVAALMRDLAPLIGGVVTDNSDDWRGRLDVDGLRIWISPEHGARKGRVEIGSSDPRTCRLHHGASALRFPSITVDASRPLDKIAAEIKRRVIEPGRATLQIVTGKLAMQNENDGQLAAHVAALLARLPFARIDVKQDVAAIYASKAGGSVTGSMRSDGKIWVDRVSCAPDRVPALLAAVFGD